MSGDLALEADVLADVLQDPVDLGQALRRARKTAGMTQEEAGQRLGMKRTTIVAIEQGQRHVRAQELQSMSALYQRDIRLFFDQEQEMPTSPVLSARKRVIKRVFRCEPDATMHATLLALALPPKELERMAATVLHMLITQEGEPSMSEEPTTSMLTEILDLAIETLHLRDENKRLAQRSLALIAYSEDCFEAMSDLLKLVETMKALHARGTELLPLLVPQKETTRECPSNG